jgi:hypothetical protein
MFRTIIAASAKVRAVLVDGDQLLTVQEAARLAGRSDEAVRIWCRQAGIGEYDVVARRYFISRRLLVEHILQNQGVLPHGLRQTG